MSTRDSLAEIRALLAERVQQAQCGELVSGSITEIAEQALQNKTQGSRLKVSGFHSLNDQMIVL